MFPMMKTLEVLPIEVQRQVVHGFSTDVLASFRGINSHFRDMILLPEVMVDVAVPADGVIAPCCPSVSQTLSASICV